MGTSASNPGPRGRASLLPPWAAPLDDDLDAVDLGTPPDDAAPEPSDAAHDPGSAAESDAGPDSPDDDPGSWTSPRRLIGNLAASALRRPGAQRETGRALRRAVRAMGGARGAAAASPAGRRTARALGGFLSAVASGGLAEAAREFGLADYVGRGAEVFMARLADALAPDGAATEDAVARAALLATLSELEERLDLAGEGIEALERISPELMGEMMVLFYANHVYERLMNALADHLARRAVSCDRVREVERDARQYVRDAVQADLPVRAPVLRDGARLVATRWRDDEGRRLADRIFAEAYAVMEADLA